MISQRHFPAHGLLGGLAGFLALTLLSGQAQEISLAAFAGGQALPAVPVQADGTEMPAWPLPPEAKAFALRPQAPWQAPAAGPLYLAVTYLDQGYGRLAVTYKGGDGKALRPAKALRTVFLDSGKWATAYFRLDDLPPAAPETQVARERGADAALTIAKAVLSPVPFDDAHFRYILDDPWKKPYSGPTVPAPDNTTLKGKVMVGYQGWFRTPNDPYDRGWVHWGDMAQGAFSTDMWPDVSEYPPETLDKACDVKTRSGKTAYLFSSAWPEVARVHFRWMRENNIDGAFLQRFVGGDNYAVRGTPQWVLAAVRAGAAQEGRIWAVEYDLSGVPDAQAPDLLRKDWAWLVDEAQVTKDANYARVGGKPVVFVWGPGVADRGFTPDSTARIADFFKNDPRYGGNYFIVGGPGNWRKLPQAWQDAYRKCDGLLGWMSQAYADDLAQCREMGLDYYPHAWPGFSWANLKHLPTGSSDQFTARNAGAVFEGRFAKAAQAGCDRLFVGMFDEYDEGTAIMPMSDDPPPTPERPGALAKFFADPKAQERAVAVPRAQVEQAFDAAPPARGIPPQNYLMRWAGLLAPPSDGSYTFAVEGAPGDAAGLWINDKKVLDVKRIGDGPEKTATVDLRAGQRAVYRVDYAHATEPGTFRLVWQGPSLERQPIPADALSDAWGRFLTNEGRPAGLYLKLAGEARDMINGKRPATDLTASAAP